MLPPLPTIDFPSQNCAMFITKIYPAVTDITESDQNANIITVLSHFRPLVLHCTMVMWLSPTSNLLPSASQ